MDRVDITFFIVGSYWVIEFYSIQSVSTHHDFISSAQQLSIGALSINNNPSHLSKLCPYYSSEPGVGLDGQVQPDHEYAKLIRPIYIRRVSEPLAKSASLTSTVAFLGALLSPALQKSPCKVILDSK
jgi:hypothetical protein